MIKYKNYYRKTSFKKDKVNAEILLSLVNEYKPKKFLEVGVLEGATARNVCEIMYKLHGNNFNYFGIDLFGHDMSANNEKEFTPISKKYSNPFKFIYFNFILRHHPNSLKGVNYLLKKFNNSVNLYQGYSKNLLRKINLQSIDFVFLDGGHSYKTVKEDLEILLENLKTNSVVVLDDYDQKDYGVRKAADEVKDKFENYEKGRFLLIKK
jgi:predicted O-methyltransferase YrrM